MRTTSRLGLIRILDLRSPDILDFMIRRPLYRRAARRRRSARPRTARRARPDRRPHPATITPCPTRPSSRAGVVAHIVAASTSDRPTRSTSVSNARSIVSTLPASVPSARNAADSPTVIGLIAEHARDVPTGRAGGRGAVGDRHDSRRAFGRHRGPNERGMDVHAVADQLGRDFFGLQHRARPGPARDGRAAACG